MNQSANVPEKRVESSVNFVGIHVALYDDVSAFPPIAADPLPRRIFLDAEKLPITRRWEDFSWQFIEEPPARRLLVNIQESPI
jgi:hypothetical protein